MTVNGEACTGRRREALSDSIPMAITISALGDCARARRTVAGDVAGRTQPDEIPLAKRFLDHSAAAL